MPFSVSGTPPWLPGWPQRSQRVPLAWQINKHGGLRDMTEKSQRSRGSGVPRTRKKHCAVLHEALFHFGLRG